MKKIILFVAAVVSSSCAINYKMPDNRFETPESNGGFGKSKIYFGAGAGKDIELTTDYSQKWVDTKNPSINEAGFVNIGGSMGLIERLDLGVDYVSDLGVVIKGKYHIVGKSREHGPQMALVAKTGFGSENRTENNHTPTSAKLRNSMVGVDGVVGWRTGGSFLLYASGFYDKATYRVTQSRGTVSNNYKGNSENFGGTFGIDFNMSKKVDLILEYARAKAKSASNKLTTSSVGGVLGISF